MLKKMITQEREARLQLQENLRAANELVDELHNEIREERERSHEERRQPIAIQQAMLDTIVRLAEGRNGNGVGDAISEKQHRGDAHAQTRTNRTTLD